MTTVTQITQFLYQNDPRSNMGKLSLYHYLKNAAPSAAAFDEDLVRDFVFTCLQFDHWRSLWHELHSDLEMLLHQLIHNHLASETLLAALPPLGSQFLELENPDDLEALIRMEETSGAQIRKIQILPFGTRGRLLLALNGEGELEVSQYNPRAWISRGRLSLFSPQSRLHYNSQMDLKPGVSQRLYLNGLQSFYFYVEEQKYIGRTVQSHLFQTVSNFEGSDLSSQKELFQSLKAIERHFIESTSDPYYQEVVDELEKAYHLLHNKHSQAPDFAYAALKRGRAALQSIYSKDKLLLLLVTNIEYLLRPYDSHAKTVSAQRETMWQKPKPLPV